MSNFTLGCCQNFRHIFITFLFLYFIFTTKIYQQKSWIVLQRRVSSSNTEGNLVFSAKLQQNKYTCLSQFFHFRLMDLMSYDSPWLPGGHKVQDGSCSGQSPLSLLGAALDTARLGSNAARSGSPAPPGQCRRRQGKGQTSWRTAGGLASSR